MSSSTFSLDRRSLLSATAATTLATMSQGLSATQASAAELAAASQSPRREVLLADGWRFHLGHASDPARDFGFGAWQRSYAKPGFELTGAAAADFDDSAWESIKVPHDWASTLPYAAPGEVPKGKEDFAAAHGFRAIGRDFPQNSVGWYRLRLPVDPQDQGRAVWLEFDGVFRASRVIVNGYDAGGSESGYAPFRIDIGDFLNYDGKPNQLAVRVDASLGEGWFYEGAGIYRHVKLVSAARQHIPQWGVFVRAQPQAGGAKIEISTEVVNGIDQAVSLELRHRILAPDGSLVPAADSKTACPFQAAGMRVLDASIALANAQLWSVEQPNLYRLVSEVIADGQVIDRVETKFGIRSLRFDGRKGFFLNGKPVKLLGVCNHQDHAGVGTAIPDALHRWRVARMQEMGANAWRSAHNPSSQALLDICDEAGVLMIAETRANTSSKDGMDQLDRMIRSSRNHPSIILWSVGNEEGHQGTPRGRKLSERLVARCRELDPGRLTMQAMDSGWYEDGAARAVDVVGFNYRTDKIAAFKEKYPDVPVLGSETGSTVATRGEYANNAARHILRAYDTEHPWWAANAEQWWPIVANDPGIAGGFIWTGFDYRGEPTPFPAFPSVSTYFGVTDLCGFPKDNFYYYRAWWRPDLPQVHLLPHWNWTGKEGQPIEVWVHGNAAEVELRLNGRSLGRKAMPRNSHLEWQVPYAPGQIEAIGFDPRGKIIARDMRRTSGPAAKIRLASSARRLRADNADMAVVTVEILDSAGRPVPTANTSLRFTLEGPGRLLGTGNGDPTDTTADHSSDRRAFNGLAQVLVQSGTQPGALTLVAEAKGLPAARIGIFVQAS